MDETCECLIAYRNPVSKTIGFVTDPDKEDGSPMVFKSKAEAFEAANNSPACEYYTWQLLFCDEI